jgi:hypothetical protein
MRPWLGLSRLKLLQGVPYFLRIGSRQGVACIHKLLRLYGDAAVLGRYLHEVPLRQGERFENRFGDDDLAPLADAAYSAGSWGARPGGSARHTLSLSALKVLVGTLLPTRGSGRQAGVVEQVEFGACAWRIIEPPVNLIAPGFLGIRIHLAVRTVEQRVGQRGTGFNRQMKRLAQCPTRDPPFWRSMSGGRLHAGGLQSGRGRASNWHC